MKLRSHLKDYYARLDGWVDEIWDEMIRRKMTARELAASAKLSEQTVSRLNTYATRYPRLSTVFQLATAVGLSFVLTEIKQEQRGRKAS